MDSGANKAFIFSLGHEWEITVRWDWKVRQVEANLTIAVPRPFDFTGRMKLETGFINLSQNFHYEDITNYGANGQVLWLFAEFPFWVVTKFIEILYERDPEETEAAGTIEISNVSIVPFKSDADPLDPKWTYCPATIPGLVEENHWITLSRPNCKEARVLTINPSVSK